MPVTIPEKPVTTPTKPDCSVIVVGDWTRILGAIVYPKPGFVIANPSMTPFVIETVAVAVVATPTDPSDLINVPIPTDGDEIDIEGADVYPLPPPTIVNPDTVPPAEIVDVIVVIPISGKGVLEIIRILNSGEVSAS